MAIVLQKPNFTPYVCMVCGVGDDRRKWYADLQITGIEFYLNPVNDGAVYLCNECWESLAVDIAKQAQTFLFGMESWAEGQYVEPTYNNEEVIDVKHTIRSTVPGNRDIEPIHIPIAGTSSINEGDNQEPERDDPTPDTSEPDVVADVSGDESERAKLGDFFSK